MNTTQSRRTIDCGAWVAVEAPAALADVAARDQACIAREMQRTRTRMLSDRKKRVRAAADPRVSYSACNAPDGQ